MNRRRPENGFALFELILTLLLLGILASVSIIGARRTDAAHLCAVEERLKSHIRYARLLAMSGGGREVEIRFQPQAYTLYLDGLTADINWPDADSAVIFPPSFLFFSVQPADNGILRLRFASHGGLAGDDTDIMIRRPAGGGLPELSRSFTVNAATGYLP